MPVELLPGESKQLDVQLTPVAGPGELMIQRFYIVTIPAAGDGYWQMHCDIYNPGTQPASGAVHVTGRLWTNEPWANYPVDEVFEFTLESRKTYKCYTNWRKYNYIPEGASCWFEVNTSWGEKVPRTNWTAGYYPGSTTIQAYSITTSSAILLYSHRNASRKFAWSVWSPPTWPDHVIYEDCNVSADDYATGYTTCFWHVLTLLSNRQYKVEASGDGMDYADMLFNTP